MSESEKEFSKAFYITSNAIFWGGICTFIALVILSERKFLTIGIGVVIFFVAVKLAGLVLGEKGESGDVRSEE